MEENGEPRNRPIPICPTDAWQTWKKKFNEGKEAFSTNSARATAIHRFKKKRKELQPKYHS